jgi:hypothetical protein
MFEQIYQWPRVIERHRQAPLRSEREQYLRHLIEKGYSQSKLLGVAAFMLHIIRVLGLNELRVVNEEEIQKGANVWAEYRGPFRDSKHNKSASPRCFITVARTWFRFLGVLGLPPEAPFHEQLRLYSHALQLHQGLAAVTIRGYSNRAHVFLKWLAAQGGDRPPGGSPAASSPNASRCEAFFASPRCNTGAHPISGCQSTGPASLNTMHAPWDQPGNRFTSC